jgi:general stress protein YciG
MMINPHSGVEQGLLDKWRRPYPFTESTDGESKGIAATEELVPRPDASNPSKERKMANDNTSNRGFGSMDPEKQREIAAQGGRAAHEKGTAHEFSSEEAREAGRKGGQVAHERGTAHEFDSQEAREAGSKGGQASGGNFANDRERAAEAGRKGGQNSQGGGN